MIDRAMENCYIAQFYLRQMSNVWIDGKKLPDEFILTHRRYDKRNRTFQNLTVGERNGKTMSQ